MKRLLRVAITGTCGTIVMTASSYLMSVLFRKNFREPKHLGKMMKRMVPALSQQQKMLSGWAAHLAMGLVFACLYDVLWAHNRLKPSLKNASLLGTVSGVAGYFIWKATFKTHPWPTMVNRQPFYLQRIPAHILFALAATLAYRLLMKYPPAKRPSIH